METLDDHKRHMLTPHFVHSDAADAIAARILDGDTRVQRLVLAPGAGKTTLMHGVAHRLRDTGRRVVALSVSPMIPERYTRSVAEIAAQLGPDVSAQTLAALEHPDAPPERALDVLRQGLLDLGALVLVDDAHNLRSASDASLALLDRHRMRALADWIDAHCAVTLATPQHGDALLPLNADPGVSPYTHSAHDTDALWRRSGFSPERFGLLLTCARLDAPWPDSAPVESARICEHIWARLPAQLRRLIALLVIHRHPLPDDVMRLAWGGDTLDAALDQARALALLSWTPTPSTTLAVPHAWSSAPLLTRTKRKDHSHTLAEAFARWSGSDSLPAADAFQAHIQACRHFIGADAFELALDHARNNTLWLIAHAQNLSPHDPQAARCAYDAILTLHAETRCLSRHAWAYATHYAAFNAYKAHKADPHAPPPTDTLTHYQAAVDAWPDNVHFQARLVRATCYAHGPAPAAEAFDRAWRAVPEHPLKHNRLVARSVDRIAQNHPEHLAFALWMLHKQPDPHLDALPEQLTEALERGWKTRCLWAGRDLVLPLYEPVQATLRWDATRACWVAAVARFDADHDADAAFDAWAGLVDGLRRETGQLLRKLTHLLNADKRKRKRLLLASVDLNACDIAPAAPEHVWRSGTLVSSGGAWMLEPEPHHQAPRAYPIASALDPQALGMKHGDSVQAKVRANRLGYPIGPVVHLEPSVSPQALERLIEAWNRDDDDTP